MEYVEQNTEYTWAKWVSWDDVSSKFTQQFKILSNINSTHNDVKLNYQSIFHMFYLLFVVLLAGDKCICQCLCLFVFRKKKYKKHSVVLVCLFVFLPGTFVVSLLHKWTHFVNLDYAATTTFKKKNQIICIHSNHSEIGCRKTCVLWPIKRSELNEWKEKSYNKVKQTKRNDRNKFVSFVEMFSIYLIVEWKLKRDLKFEFFLIVFHLCCQPPSRFHLKIFFGRLQIYLWLFEQKMVHFQCYKKYRA